MITRIAYSDKINQGKFAALIEQAERLGMVRSEAWERFGSIAGIGLGDFSFPRSCVGTHTDAE